MKHDAAIAVIANGSCLHKPKAEEAQLFIHFIKNNALLLPHSAQVVDTKIKDDALCKVAGHSESTRACQVLTLYLLIKYHMKLLMMQNLSPEKKEFRCKRLSS